MSVPLPHCIRYSVPVLHSFSQNLPTDHKRKIYDFPLAIFVWRINYAFIHIFHSGPSQSRIKEYAICPETRSVKKMLKTSWFFCYSLAKHFNIRKEHFIQRKLFFLHLSEICNFFCLLKQLQQILYMSMMKHGQLFLITI